MRTLKQLAKRTAYKVAPAWADEVSQRWWLISQAKKLRYEYAESRSIEECVDGFITHKSFRANQKRSEILRLLQDVQRIRPRFFCEIGSYYGGTLALFCRVAARDARIVSIDLGFTKSQIQAYPYMRLGRQRMTCLAGDSHSQDTRDAVLRSLRGNFLDFLFIDGDHSYTGVCRDYEMYGSLVRPGGIIAFHDIVPDFQTRFGTPTGNDVGEVPKYWSTLKEQHPDAVEYIDDVTQDGYGIGVIRVKEQQNSLI